MQLYVADYLGDTMHLSTEQHGAYLLLLMAMWRAGGSLPNDEKKLARIVGLSTIKWRRVAADVMAFFTVDGDEITAWHLERWPAEYRKMQGRTPLPQSVRQAIIERDGQRCRYCGGETGPFQIDHIVPFVRGGTDDHENLTVACKPCNQSKGFKLLGEWRQ
tara:strand:- start:5821 stop:6303 length:483 start_codon:yes stop_codon:yes gene_type:complete